MCERKSSGKSHVDGSVQEQYKQGGEGREQLEMAMLECIAKHGVSRHSFKRIKVGWDTARIRYEIIHTHLGWLSIYKCMHACLNS